MKSACFKDFYLELLLKSGGSTVKVPTGGIRASIYNSMPLEGVELLRDYMKEFECKAGI